MIRSATLLATLLILAPAAAQETPPVTPLDAATLYEEGRAARLAGRFDQAATLLGNGARLEPENADIQVELGLALTVLGRLDPAERAFRAALDIAPEYTDARIGLARVLMRGGDLAGAEAAIARAREERPDDEDLSLLADQTAAAREEEAAGRRRAAEEDRASRERAETAVRAAAEARAGARRAAEIERLADEAAAARQAGDFTRAESLYDRALALEPGNVDLIIARGLVLGFQNRLDEAETAFREALGRAPGSLDAELGLVRTAIWRGDVETAGARLAALAPRAPDNREVAALEARLFLLANRPRESERAFAAILAVDPGNVEARVGLGDARRALGRDRAAREDYQAALALDPGSAEIRERLQAPARPRWRIDVDGTFSALSGDREDWREGALRAAYEIVPGTVVSGGVEMSSRFGATDAYIEGRVDHVFTPIFAAYAMVGGTPDADFRPRVQIGAGGALRLREGSGALGPSVATLDLRHAAYATGSVQTVSPGIEQYFLDGRLWLTGRWINVFDETGSHVMGYSLRADALLTDRLAIFAGWSDAPDPSEGIVVDTRSLFGGMRYDLTETLSVRASYAREERDASFDRDVFNLGLTVRF